VEKPLPIEEPCAVREALAIIKAVGDCLVSIHAGIHYGGVEPCAETIQTLGFLLIEKARCAAETLGVCIDD